MNYFNFIHNRCQTIMFCLLGADCLVVVESKVTSRCLVDKLSAKLMCPVSHAIFVAFPKQCFPIDKLHGRIQRGDKGSRPLPGIARLLIFAMLKFSVRPLLGIWTPLRKFSGSAHELHLSAQMHTSFIKALHVFHEHQT